MTAMENATVNTTDTQAPESAAGPVTLQVRDLRIDLVGRDVNVVDDISFDLHAGEILGVIGESGSGKTTVGSALLGFARAGTRITGGSVSVDGVDLLALPERRLREMRGAVVAYVPQDPHSSLDPTMRIGAQLDETLVAHGVGSKAERAERIRAIMEEVRLPATRDMLRRYPHELSGGQQQRVVIANGFICNPKVVVLDEPTTGLDVTTQSYVLEMVRRLCDKHRTAGIYVSHDLAVVAGLADRIAVMYYGRLVELGPASEVVNNAGHPYSRGLIEVIPDPAQRHVLHTIPGRVAPIDRRPDGCVFAERCALVEPECRTTTLIPLESVGKDHVARCLRTETLRATARGVEVIEQAQGGDDAAGFLTISNLQAAYGGKVVLKDINLTVAKGKVTALVGESGSGKTTLARCLGGLHDEATGEVLLGGKPLRLGARNRSKQERASIQYIFQNATEALNPRRTVRDSLAEPLLMLGTATSQAQRGGKIDELLEQVALDPRMADRYPSQLSGGERQRVTIARALATDPSVLICDEITSALDVSVQASILLLIQRLCAENELTLLFVTHNLAVVRAIADQVAVLNLGSIVEQGWTNRVLDAPEDDYTKNLLANTPSLSWA